MITSGYTGILQARQKTRRVNLPPFEQILPGGRRAVWRVICGSGWG